MPDKVARCPLCGMPVVDDAMLFHLEMYHFSNQCWCGYFIYSRAWRGRGSWMDTLACHMSDYGGWEAHYYDHLMGVKNGQAQ